MPVIESAGGRVVEQQEVDARHGQVEVSVAIEVARGGGYRPGGQGAAVGESSLPVVEEDHILRVLLHQRQIRASIAIEIPRGQVLGDGAGGDLEQLLECALSAIDDEPHLLLQGAAGGKVEVSVQVE